MACLFLLEIIVALITERDILVFVMKNITMDEANRAQELFNNIQDDFQELCELLKSKMSYSEQDQFRYSCLGHLEPGLKIDHTWFMGRGSSIKPLEKWVEDAVNEATDSEECEEEDEE